MITDRIGLHSVLLPLLIITVLKIYNEKERLANDCFLMTVNLLLWWIIWLFSFLWTCECLIFFSALFLGSLNVREFLISTVIECMNFLWVQLCLQEFLKKKSPTPSLKVKQSSTSEMTPLCPWPCQKRNQRDHQQLPVSQFLFIGHQKLLLNIHVRWHLPIKSQQSRVFSSINRFITCTRLSNLLHSDWLRASQFIALQCNFLSLTYIINEHCTKLE